MKHWRKSEAWAWTGSGTIRKVKMTSESLNRRVSHHTVQLEVWCQHQTPVLGVACMLRWKYTLTPHQFILLFRWCLWRFVLSSRVETQPEHFGCRACPGCCSTQQEVSFKFQSKTFREKKAELWTPYKDQFKPQTNPGGGFQDPRSTNRLLSSYTLKLKPSASISFSLHFTFKIIKTCKESTNNFILCWSTFLFS